MRKSRLLYPKGQEIEALQNTSPSRMYILFISYALKKSLFLLVPSPSSLLALCAGRGLCVGTGALTARSSIFLKFESCVDCCEITA
jgi:hypothetical protein